MSRLRLSLSGVVTGGCAKPDCGHRAAINRHHKAHEALWLGAWAHRGNEPKWQSFVHRYYEYRAEDVCVVCVPHHAEIHSLYDEIIADDLARTGLPLYLYSWKQAEVLMDRLRAACEAWLPTCTPGIDPEKYEASKKRRRAALKAHARKRYPQKPGHEKLAKLRGKKLRRRRKPRKRGPR